MLEDNVVADVIEETARISASEQPRTSMHSQGRISGTGGQPQLSMVEQRQSAASGQMRMSASGQPIVSVVDQRRSTAFGQSRVSSMAQAVQATIDQRRSSTPLQSRVSAGRQLEVREF